MASPSPVKRSTLGLQGAELRNPAPKSKSGVAEALGHITSLHDCGHIAAITARGVTLDLFRAKRSDGTTPIFSRPDYADQITGKANGYTFALSRLSAPWSAEKTKVVGVAVAPDGKAYEFSGEADLGMLAERRPGSLRLDFSRSNAPIGEVALR